MPRAALRVVRTQLTERLPSRRRSAAYRKCPATNTQLASLASKRVVIPWRSPRNLSLKEHRLAGPIESNRRRGGPGWPSSRSVSVVSADLCDHRASSGMARIRRVARLDFDHIVVNRISGDRRARLVGRAGDYHGHEG